VFISKRHMWIGLLAFLTCASSLLGVASLEAHAAAADGNGNRTYYGTDLHKMALATGVNFEQPNTIPQGAPWPQRTNNYCFLSVVQAMVNYADLKVGLPMRYPTQSSQGPASDDPADETHGQILYDMDHYLIPPDGPLKTIGTGPNRRPYTLANIAYDFGGDPRAEATAVTYETPGNAFYHDHIYHNGPQAATLGIAQALARYGEPVIAAVNHAEHFVIVAGVWTTGNPLTDQNVQIRALAVYNPWDQSWGAYLSTGYYTRVSYNDWINATNLPGSPQSVHSWFGQPYQSNGDLDPDPSISRYQAGPGTLNPNAQHWIGNYVTIERDDHPVSANFSFDENDQMMLQP
jgi:hypothetical protein